VNLATLALLPDEAYYWLWSRQLDWAYYDHPAGTALLLRLSTELGGQSEFGIRWLNVLLAIACVTLLWALEERLSAGRTAHVAAWVVALGAPYLIISRFVYTDVLFLFLMLLNFSFFLRLLSMGSKRAPPTWPHFALWGLTLLLLLNTKYTAFLYIAGIGLWLLLRRYPLLHDYRFWIAGALGSLGLLPVIGWNAAHNWASFRWQLSHLLSASPGVATRSLVGMWFQNIRHAIAYLTWPVATTALVAATIVVLQQRSERTHREARSDAGLPGLLGLLALTLLVPVLLSPSGSPRNLLGGLVFVFMGPSALGRTHRSAARRRLAPLWAALAALVVLYGAGTVAGLSGITTSLRSSVVRENRRDTAGIQELGQTLGRSRERSLFAVDYSLAGQLAYYSEKPVTTSWGQYRFWAEPDLSSLVLVSHGYVSLERIDRQLRSAYTVVNGPFSRRIEVEGDEKWVYWWLAEGLRWTSEQVVQAFDFFALADAQP
jgi:4-amino-4-deoxy-L-arabinose transferase-like glycosyltransferase